MPQRSGRVGVAERLQPVSRRFRRQPGCLAWQPGDGVEQRPVEQLLVQLPRLAGVPPPFRGQRGGRITGDRQRGRRRGAASARGQCGRLTRGQPHPPQRPADLPQHRRVLGQQVRAPQLAQLQQVLDPAQEPVRRRHRRRVGAADVAAGGQRGQGRQRARLAQPLVGPAVHELQQLDRELDVAQAARSELQLPAGLVRGQALDHPAAHGLHVGDEVLALRGVPHHGRDGGQVLRRRARRRQPRTWP